MALGSPLIIPIFISHQGCPHRCIFCNQEGITGTAPPVNIPKEAAEISREIEVWLDRADYHARQVQVAFYGGSFTGLPESWQKSYLGAVQPYLASGQVQAIRLSTRPDYIGPDTGRFLWEHGVRTVEIGVQSMDASVLQASRRGHSRQDVARAFSYLRQLPLKIGGQLMVGLPAESSKICLDSARALRDLSPDFIRIYPTLVLRGSALAQLYQGHSFQPISLAKAVVLSSRIVALFKKHQIGVIRIGLQPTADL